MCNPYTHAHRQYCPWHQCFDFELFSLYFFYCFARPCHKHCVWVFRFHFTFKLMIRNTKGHIIHIENVSSIIKRSFIADSHQKTINWFSLSYGKWENLSVDQFNAIIILARASIFPSMWCNYKSLKKSLGQLESAL